MGQRWIAPLLALPVAGVLLLFNLRRLAFLLAAAADWLAASRSAAGADRDRRTADRLPASVLLLVPLRNEATSLPGLLASLSALDYPAERLTIGLIDDGSMDGTAALLDGYAEARPGVQVLRNPASLGKAAALNAGLHRWPAGEIVAVYDADARPEPDSLRRIVAAFEDPAVAAAGGLIRPANGLATPAATYSAIERLVHQQVTMRAKDRLRLAPAILGSHCAYRRRDLAAAGGFPPGAFLEDSHLTVRLARQGRRTRFLPLAVAHDRVPETLRGYWRQHVRWSRGFHDVAAGSVAGHTAQAGWRGWLLDLELRLFSLGYLDRLALAAGLGWLAMKRRMSRDAADRHASPARPLLISLIGANLLLPYAQIALALLIERAAPAWWLRLPLVPLFFAVDVAAAIWSAALSLSRRPRAWQPTERTRNEFRQSQTG